MELLKGILIGFIVAMPVGPVALLCMNYTLSHGFRLGLIAGLGAALADTLFGAIAGFGFTTVHEWLLAQTTYLTPIGSLALIGIGLRTYFSKISHPRRAAPSKSYVKALLTTLFLTLSNPMTLITLTFMMACFAITPECCTAKESIYILSGIGIGSFAWWFSLTGLTTLVRDKFSFRMFVTVRQVSAIILTIVGALLLTFYALGRFLL